MPLKQFVDEHPDCEVARPDLVAPALMAALPGMGLIVAVVALIGAIVDGSWLASIAWFGLGAVLLMPTLSFGKHLLKVLELYRHGYATFAVTDEDLLLVDAAGNAVVVALDRVIGLEVVGDEARLRTDSDLQGVVYTVMFQLFDPDVPGPTAERFFDILAPRLRQCAPHAVIERHEPGEGALIA